MKKLGCGIILFLLLIEGFAHKPSTQRSSPIPTQSNRTAISPVKISKDSVKVAVTRNTQGKRLSNQEIRAFYAEIQKLFLERVPHVVDTASLQSALIQLNERGWLGVEAIFSALQKVPQTEAEGKKRMAYVDYLLYRMRWDFLTRERVGEWISDGSENEEIPTKSLAMILAEKTELLEGLARVDVEAAKQVLTSIGPSFLFELGQQEVVAYERGEK